MKGNLVLDWNVVATVRDEGFIKALALLEQFGPVSRTEFFNVLVMRVDDIPNLLEALRQQIEKDPEVEAILARLVPASHVFTFRTPEEFKTKASEGARTWVQQLAGRRFHVRMHRRGFKGRLSSLAEEQFLDEVLLNALEKIGHPGLINFDDPDVIVSVETVAQRAGLSLWNREDLQRYPFLHLD
jgi:tRNA(Ser,Leu) C12 N-acetylase TAN1